MEVVKRMIELINRMINCIIDLISEKPLLYNYYNNYSKQERDLINDMVDYLKYNKTCNEITRFIENKKYTMTRDSFCFILKVE